MATRPILFNTKMVQAILEGRKTQTRRVITLPAGLSGKPVGESGDPCNPLGFMYDGGIKRPPCNKGDILWVRETFDHAPCSPGGHFRPGNWYYYYKADGDIRPDSWKGNWHPSIHMPKEAARIFLVVKDIWVERLKDICVKYEYGPDHPVAKEGFGYTCDFIATWENTVKKEERGRYGWDANPWVWVIEFERCQKPESWREGKEEIKDA